MVSKRKGRARHSLEKGSLKKLCGCRQERLKEVRGKWSSNAEIKLKLRQLSAALFTHHISYGVLMSQKTNSIAFFIHIFHLYSFRSENIRTINFKLLLICGFRLQALWLNIAPSMKRQFWMLEVFVMRWQQNTMYHFIVHLDNCQARLSKGLAICKSSWTKLNVS